MQHGGLYFLNRVVLLSIRPKIKFTAHLAVRFGGRFENEKLCLINHSCRSAELELAIRNRWDFEGGKDTGFAIICSSLYKK